MDSSNPLDNTPYESKSDSKDQVATQDVLKDDGTGKYITGDYLYLKDERGDNHYFQNWQSVVEWAQANADKA